VAASEALAGESTVVPVLDLTAPACAALVSEAHSVGTPDSVERAGDGLVR
jgi:hypothetical protein